MNGTEWHGWRWFPDRSGWFVHIRMMALRWRPPASLGLDADRMREKLCAAADENAAWLVHPCLSVLHEPERFPESAHVRLAVWLAVNTPPVELSRLRTTT